MKAATLPTEICWEIMGKRGMAITRRDVFLGFTFKNQVLSVGPIPCLARIVKGWNGIFSIADKVSLVSSLAERLVD